jgi:hypothetical protein
LSPGRSVYGRRRRSPHASRRLCAKWGSSRSRRRKFLVEQRKQLHRRGRNDRRRPSPSDHEPELAEEVATTELGDADSVLAHLRGAARDHEELIREVALYGDFLFGRDIDLLEEVGGPRALLVGKLCKARKLGEPAGVDHRKRLRSLRILTNYRYQIVTTWSQLVHRVTERVRIRAAQAYLSGRAEALIAQADELLARPRTSSRWT